MPPRGGLMGNGDPSPRRFDGKSPAVLGIHGYGGTPMEVDLVVDVARELGLAARAPLLAGHGRRTSELAGTRFEDWLDSARAELDALGSEPVIVVGLSLGSLLATALTLQQPSRVVGLCLLANAFWLSAPFPAWPLAAYNRWPLPDVHLPKKTADIRDPEARATHLTLSAQPARAAAEVWGHGRRLRERLGEIRCPAYVAHGRWDLVCPSRNLRRVAARLGSVRVTTRSCPRSGHIITRDYDRDLVQQDLMRFFRDCARCA